MIPVSARHRGGHDRKPRASGDDPWDRGHLGLAHGVNPARAGMILRSGQDRLALVSKPRASGDDPGVQVTGGDGSQ